MRRATRQENERFVQQVYPRVVRLARVLFSWQPEKQNDFLAAAWRWWIEGGGSRPFNQIIWSAKRDVIAGRGLPGLTRPGLERIEKKARRQSLEAFSPRQAETPDNPARIAASRELYYLVRQRCTRLQRRVFDRYRASWSGHVSRYCVALGMSPGAITEVRRQIHQLYKALLVS